jgi:site-specific DNA recombinase
MHYFLSHIDFNRASFLSVDGNKCSVRIYGRHDISASANPAARESRSLTNINRPDLQRIMTMVHSGKVQAVIVAKLDRLTRSVKDLCGLLELFEKRKVALISVAEALDTGSAAGRLVITIMGAVSQWEREAIGERTRDALRHKRGNGERVGNISFGYRLSAMKNTWSQMGTNRPR